MHTLLVALCVVCLGAYANAIIVQTAGSIASSCTVTVPVPPGAGTIKVVHCPHPFFNQTSATITIFSAPGDYILTPTSIVLGAEPFDFLISAPPCALKQFSFTSAAASVDAPSVILKEVQQLNFFGDPFGTSESNVTIKCTETASLTAAPTTNAPPTTTKAPSGPTPPPSSKAPTPPPGPTPPPTTKAPPTTTAPPDEGGTSGLLIIGIGAAICCCCCICCCGIALLVFCVFSMMRRGQGGGGPGGGGGGGGGGGLGGLGGITSLLGLGAELGQEMARAPHTLGELAYRARLNFHVARLLAADDGRARQDGLRRRRGQLGHEMAAPTARQGMVGAALSAAVDRFASAVLDV